MNFLFKTPSQGKNNMEKLIKISLLNANFFLRVYSYICRFPSLSQYDFRGMKLNAYQSSYLDRNVRRRRYFVMCKYLISIKEMSEFRAIHVDHTLMYKDLKRRCTTIVSLILVSVTTAACLNSLVSVSN